MNTTQPHICNCRSDFRTLVILGKNFETAYPELTNFKPSKSWVYHESLGAIQIQVGTGTQWTSIGEVVNFLRGVLVESARLTGLRAAWANNHQPLVEQLPTLIHDVEPLTSMVPSDSTPLIEILGSRRIETWYQPVISATTGEVWGHECLMRGRTAEGELIGAPKMLRWAETENLMFMLDRVCRETHLTNAGNLKLTGNHRFLINFLPTAIYQPEFCLQTSLAAAMRSGLKPQQVIFEVVETEKITDRERLKGILDFYRRTGFGVALDDMGSGYAGLSLLGDLRPDLIKIDRDLIVKSVDSDSHRRICALLVQFGHDNDQLVLAEGVETVEQKELMGAMGVDLYQGYLFGKPNPTINMQSVAL